MQLGNSKYRYVGMDINYHCQADLLANLLTIPLMYIFVLWNNFLKKIKMNTELLRYSDPHCIMSINGINEGKMRGKRHLFSGVHTVIWTYCTQLLEH